MTTFSATYGRAARSATVPPEIKRLLKRVMRNPVVVSTSSGTKAAAEISQQCMPVSFRDKFKVLRKLLEEHSEGPVIVFCNTRRQTIDLDRMLWGNGYSAGSLHGDQEQEVRFKVLESFRTGQMRILVCTDVASRGLDIDDVALVVNYEIPDDEDSYVHRIGRTGRAKRKGVAISLVASKERGSWSKIERLMRGKIERVGSSMSEEQTSSSGSEGEGRGRGRGRGRDENSSEGRGREKRGRGRRGGRGRGRRGRSEDDEGATERAAADEPVRDRRGDVSSGDREPSKPAEGGFGAGLYDRPQQSKPKALLKLDEIDDDFVKTDYFDIDESLIKKAPPKKRSTGSDSGERGGGRRRGGRPAAGRGDGEADRPAGRGDSASRGDSAGREAAGSEGDGDGEDAGRSRRRRGRRGRRRGRAGGQREGAEASTGADADTGGQGDGEGADRPRRRRRRRRRGGGSREGGEGGGRSDSPSNEGGGETQSA